MPIPILMPALSPTMTEGTLARWLKHEGDEVSAGDVIAEIETDKATMEVEAVEEGKVGKILVEAGTENVAVNQVIALLLEEDEDESALEDYTPGEDKSEAKTAKNGEDKTGESGGQSDDASSQSGKSTSKAVKDEAQPQSGYGRGPEASAPPAPVSDGERIKASPLARRLAEEAGLDLAKLQGSGPHGRIVKRDIEEAKEKGAPERGKSEAAKPEKAETPAKAPAEAPQKPAGIDESEPLKSYGIPAERYEIVKADCIQKVSAKRLTESFRDVPHFPLTVDIEIDALLDFRKQINAKAPDGVKISVNDILIKASGAALKREPDANASWIPDGRVARHKHADISVAVAIGSSKSPRR